MNSIKITTTQNIELEYDLASLGDRIVAYIIDALVIGAYLIFLTFILVPLQITRSFGGSAWLSLLFYLPIYTYSLLFEVFMNGQSIGKKVMKIQVISLDGVKPSFGQYFIRWIFRLVDISMSFFLCAIISIAASERKQRIGDMVAGTAVIKTESRTNFQHTLYVPTEQADYIVTYPQVTTLGDEDVQLIKEVIVVAKNSGNHSIAEKAAEKISEKLDITNNMEATAFLKLLLADYNYMASKEEV